MDKVTHQIRLEQWTRLIEECNSSRLTKLEWCRQNKVSVKSFYYWQRKVRQRMAEAAMLPASASGPAFIELHDPSSAFHYGDPSSVQERIASVTPAAVLQKDDITIVLSNAAQQSFISALLGAMKND